jgi:hypothetical protein
MDSLPQTGLSADSVRQEVRRSLVSSEGRCVIYAGIDVDIPVGAAEAVGRPEPSPGDNALINADATTGPDWVRTTPERVKADITAAFEGGAAGVVLGEKYAQMRLENLAGVAAAIAALG